MIMVLHFLFSGNGKVKNPTIFVSKWVEFVWAEPRGGKSDPLDINYRVDGSKAKPMKSGPSAHNSNERGVETMRKMETVARFVMQ